MPRHVPETAPTSNSAGNGARWWDTHRAGQPHGITLPSCPPASSPPSAGTSLTGTNPAWQTCRLGPRGLKQRAELSDAASDDHTFPGTAWHGAVFPQHGSSLQHGTVFPCGIAFPWHSTAFPCGTALPWHGTVFPCSMAQWFPATRHSVALQHSASLAWHSTSLRYGTSCGTAQRFPAAQCFPAAHPRLMEHGGATPQRTSSATSTAACPQPLSLLHGKILAPGQWLCLELRLSRARICCPPGMGVPAQSPRLLLACKFVTVHRVQSLVSRRTQPRPLRLLPTWPPRTANTRPPTAAPAPLPARRSARW